MSNPALFRRQVRADRSAWLALVLGLGAWLVPLRLAAQTEDEPPPSAIDLYASWAMHQAKWKGPTVPWPELAARPRALPIRLDSLDYPVHVHAPLGLAPGRPERALAALESAYQRLLELGWPVPEPDGGRGGTPGFDLYLVAPGEQTTQARADAPLISAFLDTAHSHALLAPGLRPEALQACAQVALAEAALLELDPAEAPSWRAASARYLGWLTEGEFGCDAAVSELQAQPELGWLSGADPHGGAALLLAMLAEREDGGTGEFVRELWQFARQRSQLDGKLRASPDLWEALERALKNAGEELEAIVEDFAVARYFAGAPERARHSPFAVLRSLPSDAAVPVPHRLGVTDLPAHLPASPPLFDYGSRYTLVDTAALPPDTTLDIWLRGETGTRWSLIAVRLDAEGREKSRMTAPPRNTGTSYLPLLYEPGTASVLIVVTKIPRLRPDSDRPGRAPRSFRLIVDTKR